MSLNLEQKQAIVSEIAAQLANAQAVIVAEYRGVDVEAVTGLRAKARQVGTLPARAEELAGAACVAGTPFEKLSDQLVGPLIYGIAADPVAGAKVLAEFAKDNEAFVIKAGAMPNSLMSASGRQGAGVAAEPRRTAGEARSARCRRRSRSWCAP